MNQQDAVKELLKLPDEEADNILESLGTFAKTIATDYYNYEKEICDIIKNTNNDGLNQTVALRHALENYSDVYIQTMREIKECSLVVFQLLIGQSNDEEKILMAMSVTHCSKTEFVTAMKDHLERGRRLIQAITPDGTHYLETLKEAVALVSELVEA